MQADVTPNRPCPNCSSEDCEILTEIPARAFVNATYREDFAAILGIPPETRYPLVKCRKCQFVFAGYLPAKEFLQTVYERAIDHSLSRTGTVSERLGLIQCAESLLRFAIDRQSHRPLKLLDYGCGYGNLLRVLAMREIECVGFEPSATRRDQAGAGTFVTPSLEEIRERGPYDIIVCQHVLEHVPQPRDVIQFFSVVAAESSVLAVAVPDVTRLLTPKRLTEDIRADRLHDAINLWEHLNYFSPASLQALIEDFAFKYDSPWGSPAHWFNPSLRGLHRWRNAAGTLCRIWQQRPRHSAITTSGFYLK